MDLTKTEKGSMRELRSKLQTVTTWILIGAFSGVLPAAAAPAGGMPLREAMRIVAMRPSAAPEPGTPASSDEAAQAPAEQPAAPPERRETTKVQGKSPWLWVTVAAILGAGAGAAVLLGNSQSGKSAATTPTTTIGVGTGGVTAGAPH